MSEDTERTDANGCAVHVGTRFLEKIPSMVCCLEMPFEIAISYCLNIRNRFAKSKFLIKAGRVLTNPDEYGMMHMAEHRSIQTEGSVYGKYGFWAEG